VELGPNGPPHCVVVANQQLSHSGTLNPNVAEFRL
jgi:hypothetical protein